MKTTRYFDEVRNRPDRKMILDEWIVRVITNPVSEVVQRDGRIRRWGVVPEMGNRVLRVVLLPDGETIHNAFFDRSFLRMRI
ncbi:MAG: hypothetical protein ABSE79_04525 [Terriglobia bacterium]